ncbi:CSE1_6 [Sanghuangporus weigelae]
MPLRTRGEQNGLKTTLSNVSECVHVYLLTAVATLGAAAQRGVTSTNARSVAPQVLEMLIFALIRFTVATSPESVSTFEKNLFGPVHNYLTTGHRPIHSLQGVQPQLWLQLLGNVIVPQVHRILPKDRKVEIIGMTKMPISNPIALSEPAVTHWPAAFAELAKLFSEPKHLQSAPATVAGDPDEVLQTIDFEEQGTGYQAAYSKRAASEGLPEDLISKVSDPREYVGELLVSTVNREPRIHFTCPSGKSWCGGRSS